MCFDITVTEMQAERKQRDSEDPRESDTHREMEKGRGGGGLKTIEHQGDKKTETDAEKERDRYDCIHHEVLIFSCLKKAPFQNPAADICCYYIFIMK